MWEISCYIVGADAWYIFPVGGILYGCVLYSYIMSIVYIQMCWGPLLSVGVFVGVKRGSKAYLHVVSRWADDSLTRGSIFATAGVSKRRRRSFLQYNKQNPPEQQIKVDLSFNVSSYYYSYDGNNKLGAFTLS